MWIAGRWRFVPWVPPALLAPCNSFAEAVDQARRFATERGKLQARVAAKSSNPFELLAADDELAAQELAGDSSGLPDGSVAHELPADLGGGLIRETPTGDLHAEVLASRAALDRLLPELGQGTPPPAWGGG